MPDPSTEPSWDSDGSAKGTQYGDVTIDSPLPELGSNGAVSGQEATKSSIAVGAGADLVSTPAQQDSSSTAFNDVGGLSALPGIAEDRDFTSLAEKTQSSPALLRREANNRPAAMSDAQKDLLKLSQEAKEKTDVLLRNLASTAEVLPPARERVIIPSTPADDGEKEIHHHYYNPDLTPEAIFKNKELSPEIAEFLGHLAQRDRLTRKEMNRAAASRATTRAAGLAQNSVTQVSGEKDDPDDSDDVEDMKKTASRAPQMTALSHFFDEIDSKTTAAKWVPSECGALVQNVTAKYAEMFGRSRLTWGTAGPASSGYRSEIHTGMFFKHWGKDMVGKDAARKLRLNVLSFLATQDAGKVKLHIWTDQEKGSAMLMNMLGPIAHHPELMDAINITVFDHKAEFAKIAPTLARESLTELYKKDSVPNLRPDLFRSIILYNYGGLWMDADTMLVQDISPLLGEDWAYLPRGKAGVEGAIMSASKPQSHFANDYLISLATSLVLNEPEEMKSPLPQVFARDPSHTTFHVLPPCFFDSDPVPDPEVTVLAGDASLGSPFFGKSVAAPYHELFSMGIAEAAQDTSATDVSVLQNDDGEDKHEAAAPPVFAYHWRGNFGASWARGSMADVAERTFMKRLQIKVRTQTKAKVQ